MWRKLILGFIVVPLGVVLIALAVVNRKPVELILDPFGSARSDRRARGAVVSAAPRRVRVGLIVGGIATWFSQGSWRRTAREEARARRATGAARPTGWKRSSKGSTPTVPVPGSPPTSP